MATVRLQQLVVTLVFDYVPIGIAIGGIVLSIRAFFKKNNPGFLVVALVFTKPILNHVFW
jgi:predicted PurR-regulated permease PerM